MNYQIKREELNKKFEELNQKKIYFIKILKEIEAEQFRLQGESRLLEELEKLKTKEKK